MKILLLSPHTHLIPFLESFGDKVIQTEDPVMSTDADFIISYGYRHILKKPVLKQDRAINLHISYLPWNRGADPNLHSFIDGTPKGVTIHFMDEGIDTGDIIAQRYMKYDYDTDTLRTFYDKLTECLEDLFKKTWKYIRDGRAKRYPQISFHVSADREQYEHLLPLGWDTPIKDLLRGLK